MASAIHKGPGRAALCVIEFRRSGISKLAGFRTDGIAGGLVFAPPLCWGRGDEGKKRHQ